MNRPAITSERVGATPIQMGRWQVTPVAHVRTLRWQPGEGRELGLVWARPRWLALTCGDTETRQPVPDTTRGLLFMAGISGVFLAWIIARLWRRGARR